MLNTEFTERRLVEQFLEALRALPEVRAELEPSQPRGPEPDRGYDAHVGLWVAGKSVTVLIETRKALYPRDVRQVLWRLREFSRRWPREPQAHETVLLLIAESISSGAKELLRVEQVGYYDSGGSLFLPAHGVYLYVDKPPPKPVSKSMRSLFSKRRAQVLHALLMRHEDWFGVTALAGQAKVSPATASQVLTELERFDWLVSRSQGPSKERYLREPAALLDAWAKQLAVMPSPTLLRYYVPSIQTDGLVEQLDQILVAHHVEYAITHEAAGQRYAPFLSRISQVRCRMLTSPAADQAIGELGARVVSEGFNLAVIEATSPGELLFRERVNGAWLASPIQVYLDWKWPITCAGRGLVSDGEACDFVAQRGPCQGNGRSPAPGEDWFLTVKPATLKGYTDEYTVDCERVLVTLLRGLGPWKDSVYLVGGLTPRYLVTARPPAVPAHAGTLDVDIVIDLQILTDTEAYHTLEDNLRKMRFERTENDKGQKLSWRWQTRTEHGALMVLELLADAPDIAGGKVQPLPTDGTISALNIPYSSIVFDLHQVTEIQAELLDGNGVATEQVKHANLVSFT